MAFDREISMQMCREQIIENALQIARVKLMGCFIDKKGYVNLINRNDADLYVREFEMKLESEASLLLQLSTVGIEKELVE